MIFMQYIASVILHVEMPALVVTPSDLFFIAGPTMFSWIEKVIPQPPDTPRRTSAEAQGGCQASESTQQKCDEKETCVKKEADNPPDVVKTQEEEQESDKGAAGVLTWLSQGLGRVIPQPVESPTLSRANKESTVPAVVEQKEVPASETVEKPTEINPTDHMESTPAGVLSWLSQGLEKVVPQPSRTLKSGTSGGSEGGAVTVELPPPREEKSIVIEEPKISPPTPVHTPASVPVPESQPTIIEVQPATSSEPEVTATDKGSGAGVLGWLMQGLGKVVPQPENVAPLATKVEEEKPKEEEEEKPVPLPQKESKRSSDTGVFSWITQGIEKVIPQPSVIAKQDSQTITLCPVEEICILPTSPEDNLLVEDLETVNSHADETEEQCLAQAPAPIDTEEGRAPTNGLEEMCRSTSKPECREDDLKTTDKIQTFSEESQIYKDSVQACIAEGAKMELLIMSENNETDPVTGESPVKLLEDGTSLDTELQAAEGKLQVNEKVTQNGQDKVYMRGTNQELAEKGCQQTKETHTQSEKNGHLDIGQCLNKKQDQCVEGWENQDKENETKEAKIGSKNARDVKTDNEDGHWQDKAKGKVAHNRLSLEETIIIKQTQQMIIKSQSLELTQIQPSEEQQNKPDTVADMADTKERAQELKKTQCLNERDPQPEVETESRMELQRQLTEDMSFQFYGCEDIQQALWDEQNQQEDIKKQSFCEIQSEKELKEAQYDIDKMPTAEEDLHKTAEETDPREKINGQLMKDTILSRENIEHNDSGDRFDEKIKKIDIDIQPIEKEQRQLSIDMKTDAQLDEERHVQTEERHTQTEDPVCQTAEERQLSYDEDQIQTEERETQTDERFSPPVQKKSEHENVISQHAELVYPDKDAPYKKNECQEIYEVPQHNFIESKHEASESQLTEQQSQDQEFQNDKKEAQLEEVNQNLERAMQNEKKMCLSEKTENQTEEEDKSNEEKKYIQSEEEKNIEKEIFPKPGEQSVTEHVNQTDEERTVQSSVEIQIHYSQKRDSLEQQKIQIEEEVMNEVLRKDQNIIPEIDSNYDRNHEKEVALTPEAISSDQGESIHTQAESEQIAGVEE
uniref:Uncharacterized protein n=2 Tax=Xenopus tropicalis TaxID=8364 RepID=A0A803J1Y4_XENTR